MSENQPQRVSYYVWITTISDSYTENIAGRLVRRNWAIASLGSTLSLRNDDNLTTMVSFSMSKTPKSDKPEDALDMAKALEEVKDVLKRLGVRYHSLVLTETVGSTWTLGNMKKSELEKLELETKKGLN